MKDVLACCHQSKRSHANIQLKKHLSEYEHCQTSNFTESQKRGKTEVSHDFEAKVHTFYKVYRSPQTPPISQRKACSPFLASRPTAWTQTQEEFSTEEGTHFKGHKTLIQRLQDSFSFPKPVELQSLVLERLPGLPLQRLQAGNHF